VSTSSWAALCSSRTSTGCASRGTTRLAKTTRSWQRTRTFQTMKRRDQGACSALLCLRSRAVSRRRRRLEPRASRVGRGQTWHLRRMALFFLEPGKLPARGRAAAARRPTSSTLPPLGITQASRSCRELRLACPCGPHQALYRGGGAWRQLPGHSIQCFLPVPGPPRLPFPGPGAAGELPQPSRRPGATRRGRRRHHRGRARARPVRGLYRLPAPPGGGRGDAGPPGQNSPCRRTRRRGRRC